MTLDLHSNGIDLPKLLAQIQNNAFGLSISAAKASVKHSENKHRGEKKLLHFFKLYVRSKLHIEPIN